jgi:hypothetical protein
MKGTIIGLITAAILAVAPGFAQTAKQDMKNAGSATKNAAKDAGKGVGHATKTTAKKVGTTTKHTVHKGSQKVANKTSDGH